MRRGGSRGKSGAPAYFPRRLALVVPQGEAVFEFVITGHDRVGMLKEVMTVFSKYYVTLTSLDVDLVASGDFVMVSYADFRNATATAKRIQNEISKIRSVKKVVQGRASDILFERFMYPITAGGSERAIILPVSAIINYEKAMLQRGGTEGELILIEAGKPVGRGVSNTLRAYMPWVSSAALVSAGVDAMRAMGWGLCDFDLSQVRKGRIIVRVKNPMFSGLGDTSVSWLLVGVVSGLLEDVVPFPNRVEVESVKSGNKQLSFTLLATGAAPTAIEKRVTKRRKSATAN